MRRVGKVVEIGVVLFLAAYLLTGTLPLGLASVIEAYRPGDAHKDALYFQNGEVLYGKVLTKRLKVMTPYAPLDLPLGKCAVVSFEGDGSHGATVVTRNNNRISGVCDGETLLVRSELSSKPRRVHVEKIGRIVFRKTGSHGLLERPPAPKHLFVMDNGDILTGRVRTDTLPVRSGGKTLSIPFSRIESVEMMKGNGLAARVTRKDGTVLDTSLETEDISLSLDLGVRLDHVYANHVSRIAAAGPTGSAEPVVAGATCRAAPATKAPPATSDGPYRTNSIGMQLRRIEPGIFWMGTDTGSDDEGPPRRVRVPGPYYIGVLEVTQEQWEQVMGHNPAYFKDPLRPVEMVSWQDARTFCRRLSERENATYRLPTEKEWEFACRAGSTTEFPWGNAYRADYAWSSVNSRGATRIAGTRKPNAWGLYDMIGNVWEWCADPYARPGDNRPSGEDARVLRGGGWFNVPERCRTTSRDHRGQDYRLSSYIGFRVVLAPGDS